MTPVKYYKQLFVKHFFNVARELLYITAHKKRFIQAVAVFRHL
jgi:hypothetical protein